MGNTDGTAMGDEPQGLVNKVLSSLPTIDELQRGAEELRQASSDGSNGAAPDVIQRQFLIVMRHGERADEVKIYGALLSSRELKGFELLFAI